MRRVFCNCCDGLIKQEATEDHCPECQKRIEELRTSFEGGFRRYERDGRKVFLKADGLIQRLMAGAVIAPSPDESKEVKGNGNH